MRGVPAERALERHFARLRGSSAARDDAWAAFAERGLPTTRDEDWRFTSLAPLESLDFAEPESFQASLAGALEIPAAETLLIANGRARRDAEAESLADAKRSPFVALNAALRDADVALELGPETTAPVHVLHWLGDGAAPLAVHPRVRVRVRRGAKAVLVEQLVGAAGARGLSNALTELDVEAGAELDYVQLQKLPETAFHVSNVVARQAANGRLRVWSLAFGARLARTEIRARLEGEDAALELFGLVFARGQQLCDHHTTIDHATPRTTSRELVKHVLDERAHGVFHGRVEVRPQAQKTDAAQSSRALLLSDHARINAKPQLEIYADDVRCSHGATIGQLDPDQLFYLRSRGIGEGQARALLTFGFAAEVLETLPLPALRDALERELLGWLPRGATP